MDWLGWLLLGLAIWALFRYFVRVDRSPDDKGHDASPLPGPSPMVPRRAARLAHEGPFSWPAKGEFDFEVVGESNYQPALRKHAGDHGDESASTECVATLVPEPSNRYDSNAMRVDIAGDTVGYMSRDDAPRFRRRLGQKGLTEQSTFCGALIVGGWIERTGGQRKSYGVRLDLKPFE